MSTAVVWFRRDLRLDDNPALERALQRHERVLPVYVHAPHEEAPWAPGAASRWWLHHSLAALEADLAVRGSTLHLARGDSLAALRRLVRDSGATAVYWNRRYEPACRARDRAVKAALREDGVVAESFNAGLLVEPWDIATGQGEPYRVFTPFWRNARARLVPQATWRAPARLASVQLGGSLALEALALRPRIPWDSGLAVAWTPGSAGGLALLQRFAAEAMAGYKAQRDIPSISGTSRLSPHLHFGEISPRQIVEYLHELGEADPRGPQAVLAAAEPFLRELGWREFSYHLLYHFPHSAEANLNPQFDAFPWADDDPAAIERWQRGQTGIPIVDAGLRELWHTGWMHNRVRMLVASLLTKNLRQHWLHGARWFWDTLVDADLANNTQGWQWTAGTGADAAPYFRIFNPVTQGLRFDPVGDYVRRWVPELAALAGADVHAPWEKPMLARGLGYPAPLLDLRATRETALAAYQALRRG